jgi:hypothetical protein
VGSSGAVKLGGVLTTPGRELGEICGREGVKSVRQGSRAQQTGLHHSLTHSSPKLSAPQTAIVCLFDPYQIEEQARK